MKTELTAREEEVLRLVADGLTNDEIATRLAISRRTVESHLRAVFHKTGVSRRAQLVALVRDGSPRITGPARPEPAHDRDDEAAGVGQRPDEPETGKRRLQLYAAAVRGLTDRQFPLFEERVEMTVTIGERDGLDHVVERHWTTPKPYLAYRILWPITATGSPPDPDELILECDVHGQDIQPTVNPVQSPDGDPLVLILFQPGLQTTTEWTLRYRAPALWNPLRNSGEDTLIWSTATPDARHRPTINDLTLHVVFPATWTDTTVIEQQGLGRTEMSRLPTGQPQVTWRAGSPIASRYHWVLHSQP